MVDVNIKGVLYGIAAALPRFQAQNSGHLINLSSVAGHVVFPGGAVYCGTKFAVRAITEGFRQELGRSIRSTIICPGAVKSELITHVTDADTAEAIKPLTDTQSKPMPLHEPSHSPSSNLPMLMSTSSSCGQQCKRSDKFGSRFQEAQGVRRSGGAASSKVPLERCPLRLSFDGSRKPSCGLRET